MPNEDKPVPALLISLGLFVLIGYLAMASLIYFDPGIMIFPPTKKEALLWAFRDSHSMWDKAGHDKRVEAIKRNGGYLYGK